MTALVERFQIGEEGVAAGRWNLDSAQNGDGVRIDHEGAVDMPLGPQAPRRRSLQGMAEAGLGLDQGSSLLGKSGP